MIWIAAPMAAFCEEYTAVGYGDVITDDGEIIHCEDLDEEAQDYDYEEYNCEEY